MKDRDVSSASKLRSCLRPKIEAMGYLYTPPAFQSPHQFSWVRRLSPDIGVCVLVTDGRKRGNHVEVHLWVAPICLPSDLFARLDLGTVNTLLDWHEATPAIMDQVVKKLGYYEEAFPALQSVAQRDLIDPARITKPLRCFMWEQAALKIYRDRCSPHDWATFCEIVRSWVSKQISGEEFSERTFEMVRSKLGSLIDEYPAKDSKWLPHLVGGGLGMHQAAQMLFDGEFSRKARTSRSGE